VKQALWRVAKLFGLQTMILTACDVLSIVGCCVGDVHEHGMVHCSLHCVTSNIMECLTGRIGDQLCMVRGQIVY
jgi:tRNA A-37 threonylcarbamoyl transferase component Bud32